MERYRIEEHALAVWQQSPIPLAIFQKLDRRVVALTVSDGFLRLSAYPDREKACALLDGDMYRDIHPDDVSRVREAAVRFDAQDATFDSIYRFRKQTDGETRYGIVHARGEHFLTPDGVRLSLVWYNDEGIYSERGSMSDEALTDTFSSALREASMLRENRFDSLTGLPNLTYFFALAEADGKSRRLRGERGAILFLDLIGMKDFNRKHGFTEGDKLLRAAAKLLTERFGSLNCCRFSSDHFAVYTGPDRLEERLEQLISDFRGINDGRSLPVRIGIYVNRKEKVQASTACDRAKLACDRNRSVYVSGYDYFDDELMRMVSNRSYVLENFDRALEEGWIDVYYQPIVRTASRKVCDEEALARWIDPNRGLLSPAEFIPVLEDALLIPKLDLHMVDLVLANMRRKRRAGLYVVPVSINLSRVDFDACDMVEEISARTDAAGIEHSLLNIEITESVIGQDYDFMRREIERFRALGFRVWMDDFGSGYSSLDMLQQFDFGLIKFDMQFMQQFSSSPKSRIILSRLMKLASALGIDTVMEGVETEEQVCFLKDIGCDKIQGYYYSPPVPLDTILDKYERGVGIGLENPKESDYFTRVSTIDLTEPDTADNDAGVLDGIDNGVPMAVMEVSSAMPKVLRCNRAYAAFMQRSFGIELPDTELIFDFVMPKTPTLDFLEAVERCRTSTDWVKIEERVSDEITIRSFIRKIACNPVTGNVAILIVVLAML